MRTHEYQIGAALITALTMLAIMTLIGVTAMNASVLQLTMSGNTQLYLDALTAAESNLATAEQVVEAAPRGDPSPGSQSPAYIIQYLGCHDLPAAPAPGCGITPAGNTHVYLYHITALGADAKGSQHTIQSIYATLDVANPDFKPGRLAWIDIPP